MKKQYIAPESEYIDFELQDVVTGTMPLGGIQEYTDTDGNSPITNPGGESGIYENPM